MIAAFSRGQGQLNSFEVWLIPHLSAERETYRHGTEAGHAAIVALSSDRI